MNQTALFKLLMQFPANTFVGDDLSDLLTQSQLDVINGASVLGLTQEETLEVLAPANDERGTDQQIVKFVAKFEKKSDQEKLAILKQLEVIKLKEACMKSCSKELLKQMSLDGIVAPE